MHDSSLHKTLDDRRDGTDLDAMSRGIFGWSAFDNPRWEEMLREVGEGIQSRSREASRRNALCGFKIKRRACTLPLVVRSLGI